MSDAKNHAVSTEEIARRAHEIYVERGGEDGHDLDDWYRAEKELAARKENEKEAQREKFPEFARTNVPMSAERSSAAAASAGAGRGSDREQSPNHEKSGDRQMQKSPLSSVFGGKR